LGDFGFVVEILEIFLRFFGFFLEILEIFLRTYVYSEALELIVWVRCSKTAEIIPSKAEIIPSNT
jgi:hypothetical protein